MSSLMASSTEAGFHRHPTASHVSVLLAANERSNPRKKGGDEMAQSTLTPEQAQQLIEDSRMELAMAQVKAMQAQTHAVSGMASLQALGRGLLGIELPDFEVKPMPQWSG